MADAKLTALTAASALAAADLFYVSQSAASRKATGTQLLALVGTAYVPLAGGTMTGALTLPAGAVGTPSLMFTGAGATTGIYSAAANEISFAVGGARVAYINAGNLLSSGVISAGGGFNASAGNVLISTNTGALAMGSSYDVWLYRDAAATLAQRNGTTAQTLRVYGTSVDGSNYQYMQLSANGTTGVTISAVGLGTPTANQDITLTPGGTGNNILSAGHLFVKVNNARIEVSSAGAYQFSAGTAGQTGADIAFRRSAIGVVDVDSGTANAYRDLKLRNLLASGGNGSYVQTPSMTVANLAAAATAGAGARAFVTDANATTFLSTVAAGGANKVPVVSDGTNWLIG